MASDHGPASRPYTAPNVPSESRPDRGAPHRQPGGRQHTQRRQLRPRERRGAGGEVAPHGERDRFAQDVSRRAKPHVAAARSAFPVTRSAIALCVCHRPTRVKRRDVKSPPAANRGGHGHGEQQLRGPSHPHRIHPGKGNLPHAVATENHRFRVGATTDGVRPQQLLLRQRRLAHPNERKQADRRPRRSA